MSVQKVEEQLSTEEKFKDLLNRVYITLRPMDFRKESCNFRKFDDDGLCKIINLQKNKWNTSDDLEFIINIGIYFTEDKTLNNPKFKEYECIIRKRIEKNGKCWKIDKNTDIEELFEDIEKYLHKILKWFEHFENKDAGSRMILNGKADKYSDTEVFYYQTAKMLANMGYEDAVCNRIKNIWSTTFQELVKEIRDKKKK